MRRLLLAIPTLVGLSLFIFIMMRVMPGDVTSVILGDEATPESRAAVRLQLGLDKPLYRQYFEWVGQVATLNVKSLTSGRPLSLFLRVSIPFTLNLAVLTIMISLSVGIPAGILGAVKQNRMPDYITRVIAILGLCLPSFWVGMMVLFFLVMAFNWVPGRHYISPFENPLLNLRQMIWPALVLSLPQIAFLTRMTRSTVLEVLREDYVRTAHAKGLLGRTVTWRHTLPNAMIPVVTLAGMQLAHMVNGALIVETVFNAPGIGALMIQSMDARDYPFIQTLIVLAGCLVILVNLAVDILYSYIDPRIRYD